MNILIIYDSTFGNTQKVAQKIGDSLSAEAHVQMLQVAEVKPEHFTGIDVLIVGSPTRGFSPTPAIKKMLANIPAHKLDGIKILTFDTRILAKDVDSPVLTPMVRLFGYAAKPIADRLEKKGGNLLTSPEGFIVEGTEGPIKAGELDRAAQWAHEALNLHETTR